MTKNYRLEDIINHVTYAPLYFALNATQKKTFDALLKNKKINERLTPEIALFILKSFSWEENNFLNFLRNYNKRHLGIILMILHRLIINDCLTIELFHKWTDLEMTLYEKRYLSVIFDDLHTAKQINSQNIQRLFLEGMDLKNVSYIAKIYVFLAELPNADIQINAFNEWLDNLDDLDDLSQLRKILNALNDCTKNILNQFSNYQLLKRICSAEYPSLFVKILSFFDTDYSVFNKVIKLMEDYPSELLSINEAVDFAIEKHFFDLEIFRQLLFCSVNPLNYVSVYYILKKANLFTDHNLHLAINYPDLSDLLKALEYAFLLNNLNDYVFGLLCRSSQPSNYIYLIEQLNQLGWLNDSLMTELFLLTKNTHFFYQLYHGFNIMKSNYNGFSLNDFNQLLSANNPRDYANVMVNLAKANLENSEYVNLCLKHKHPQNCAQAIVKAFELDLLNPDCLRGIKKSLYPIFWVKSVGLLKKYYLNTLVNIIRIPTNRYTLHFYDALERVEEYISEEVLQALFWGSQIRTIPLKHNYGLFFEAIKCLSDYGIFNLDLYKRTVMHPYGYSLIRILQALPLVVDEELFERFISADKAILFCPQLSGQFWNPLLRFLGNRELLLELLEYPHIDDPFGEVPFVDWAQQLILFRQTPAQALQELNYNQSTHNHFVEKSISQSAFKLKNAYPSAIHHTQTNVDRFKALFEQWVANKEAIYHCALKLFNQMILEDTFQESHSQLSTIQLISIIYVICQEQSPDLSLAEKLNKFFEAFAGMYAQGITPILAQDQFLFTICAGGRFNKLMSVLAEFHPLCEIRFITKQSITLKLKSLTKESIFEHFQSSRNSMSSLSFYQYLQRFEREGLEFIWPIISSEVGNHLFAEFEEYLNDNPSEHQEFNKMLDAIIYLEISLEEISVRFSKGLQYFKETFELLKNHFTKLKQDDSTLEFKKEAEKLLMHGIGSILNLQLPEPYLSEFQGIKMDVQMFEFSLKRSYSNGFFGSNIEEDSMSKYLRSNSNHP